MASRDTSRKRNRAARGVLDNFARHGFSGTLQRCKSRTWLLYTSVALVSTYSARGHESTCRGDVAYLRCPASTLHEYASRSDQYVARKIPEKGFGDRPQASIQFPRPGTALVENSESRVQRNIALRHTMYGTARTCVSVFGVVRARQDQLVARQNLDRRFNLQRYTKHRIQCRVKQVPLLGRCQGQGQWVTKSGIRPDIEAC